MTYFMDRVKSLQQFAAQAAHSDFVQQVRTTLTQDLPALLAEMSALDPVELRDMRAGLDQGLSNLIRVCGEEQRTLNGWHAARALTLKLSLDRLAGVTLPLESTLTHYALALRRTDPRLSAISLAFAVIAPATTTTTFAAGTATPARAPTSGPLATLSAGDYRRLAGATRQMLRDAVLAAQRIQQALRGTHAQDAEVIAGVIEQMRTLVAWLRQQQERFAALLCQPVPDIAH